MPFSRTGECYSIKSRYKFVFVSLCLKCSWDKLFTSFLKKETRMRAIGSIFFIFFAVIQADTDHRIVANNEQLWNRMYVSVHKRNPTEFFNTVKQAVQQYKNNPDGFKKLMLEQDEDGWSIFFHAIEIGDPERIIFLLDTLKNFFKDDLNSYFEIINKQDAHGRTPLYVATERREKESVDILLYKVGEVLADQKKLYFKFLDSREEHLNWSPLIVATYDSASFILESLLKAAEKFLGRKSDYYQEFINARGSFGRSAVMLSINPRDRWLLLQFGARDEEEVDDPFTQKLKKLGRELLHFASHPNHQEDIKKLFKEFRENYLGNYQAYLYFLTARDEGGWTALMNASASGNSEYIKLILDGASDFFKREKDVDDVNQSPNKMTDIAWINMVLNNSDVHGRTSLDLAIARRQPEAVKTLLEEQKKIFGNSRRMFNRFIQNKTELNGFTPLLVAAYTSSDDERSFDLIKMLVERALEVFGQDSIDFERFINAQDLDKQRPLSYIVSPKIKEYLLKYGAKSKT